MGKQKYWIAIPDRHGEKKVVLKSAFHIQGILEENPDLHESQCIQMEIAPEGSKRTWHQPCKFGFFAVDEQQQIQAFENAVEELTASNTKDILWNMFKRGSQWAEQHLAK